MKALSRFYRTQNKSEKFFLISLMRWSCKLSLQHDSFGLHKTSVCPHSPPPLHLQPSPASIHGSRTKPIKVAFCSTSCHSDDNISLENGNDWSGSFIFLQPWAEICEKIALMSATMSKFWELMIRSTDWKTGNYHFSPRKMCNQSQRFVYSNGWQQ